MRILFYCGALAGGEFLGACASTAADAWPAVALLALLAALFGHGLGWRCWRCASVALLGLCLYLRASVASEQLYRERPWVRGREWMLREREEPSAAGDVRRALSRRVGIGLSRDRETASLGRAILLGERTRMPAQLKRLFVETGTMHVFAISGLHVMAIAEVLRYLLALLLVPRRLSGLAAVPLLWGYVWVIGFPPSAVRAAAMATVLLLAPVFWRQPNGLRAWEITFLAVHLLAPRLIVHVGNALSFAVMLAIVLVADRVRHLPPLRQAALVTLAAWAAGVPIAAHVFGCVTPGGLLANLVLLATAKLAVVVGALGVGASFLSTVVAAHLNNLCALGIQAMVLVADAVSRIPGVCLVTGAWSLLTCAGWYVALGLIGWLIANRERSWERI